MFPKKVQRSACTKCRQAEALVEICEPESSTRLFCLACWSWWELHEGQKTKPSRADVKWIGK